MNFMYLSDDWKVNFDFKLDDAEYAIPVVDELPSLESILTEPDCGSLSGTDDDIGAASIDKLGGSETASVGSLLSLNSLSKQRTTQTPASGAILRHVILKGICSQITSASVRITHSIYAFNYYCSNYKNLNLSILFQFYLEFNFNLF